MRATHLLLDAVGKTHKMGEMDTSGYEMVGAAKWVHSKDDQRWMGPETDAYPANTVWKLKDESSRLDEMSIKWNTQTITHAKMKPPAAEKAWEERFMEQLPWKKIWKIKSYFTSKRDEVTWLKLQHRNLWVANRDNNVQDPTCNAHGCTREESMLHLAECRVIRRKFWDKVIALMDKVGVRAMNTTKFLVLGILRQNKVAGKDAAGILFIAWRCLYAEIVAARLENRSLRLDGVYKRTVGLVILRLKAYGKKWYDWVSSKRLTKSAKKIIPEKHRKKPLIAATRDGTYQINKQLLAEYERL